MSACPKYGVPIDVYTHTHMYSNMVYVYVCIHTYIWQRALSAAFPLKGSRIVFSYHRMCSLTIECVPFLDTTDHCVPIERKPDCVRLSHRMCSMSLECVLFRAEA